jgi:hypothetical protein
VEQKLSNVRPAVDTTVMSPTVSLAMRPQPLVIHLHRQEDAECVVNALAIQSFAVGATVEGQDVLVDIRSRSLGDVLSALHHCMLENEIALVRIEIDDRTYLMEPAPSDYRSGGS